MEEQTAIKYHQGINDDSFAVWRNDGHIGYVHLAMKVVTEAMYDLVLGDYENVMSASYFFSEDHDETLYHSLWAKVLQSKPGQYPDIVDKYVEGHVDQQDLEDIRNLCTVVKTI